MSYVDGFVVAVQTKNKEAYRKFSQDAAVFFKKHGALQLVESWGDEVPKGKVTDFHSAVQAKDDETVVFSWIIWPDKAARDAGNDKVMADMAASGVDMTDMPFDGKRMIYGGFETIVQL